MNPGPATSVFEMRSDSGSLARISSASSLGFFWILGRVSGRLRLRSLHALFEQVFLGGFLGFRLELLK